MYKYQIKKIGFIGARENDTIVVEWKIRAPEKKIAHPKINLNIRNNGLTTNVKFVEGLT